MIITITIAALVTAGLLTVFWTWIKDFLNGWLRDRLESLRGPEKCARYVDFLLWLDDKICPVRKKAIELYRWFQDQVLSIKSHYRKTDTGYVKTTETIMAKPGDVRKAVRSVVEEEISWEDLPSSIRSEMLHRKCDAAELDVMEVIDNQVKEKISIMV